MSDARPIVVNGTPRSTRVRPVVSIATIVMLLIPLTAGADNDDLAAARIVFTTEPANVAACSFVATVNDDEIKDLRKKIARANGDTALLAFTGGNRITARVYRCPPREASPQPASAPPSGPPPALPWSVTGTFTGTISGNSDAKHWTIDIMFTVAQSGRLLTAQWSSMSGMSGGMNGTLGASGIPDMKLQQVRPCAGEFAGVAVVENNGHRLRGSYAGNDCGGEATGSFVVDRQPDTVQPATVPPSPPAPPPTPR